MRPEGAKITMKLLSEMAVGADTFTISAIVLLIVGAVCFYLFTRIKQVEKKLALMEGILLDLKTATEAGFLSFPAGETTEEEDDEEDDGDSATGEMFLPLKPDEEAKPMEADIEAGVDEVSTNEVRTVEIDEAAEAEAEVEAEETGSVQVHKLSSDLDSMSMTELTNLAKSRGMTVTSKMRKAQLVTALRQMNEPDGIAASSTLMDSSSLMASPL